MISENGTGMTSPYAGQTESTFRSLDGLAICQSIVLAHGGRIEVVDRPGDGTRFSVFLPAPVRARRVDSNCQPKEQANDPATDSAKNSGGDGTARTRSACLLSAIINGNQPTL